MGINIVTRMGLWGMNTVTKFWFHNLGSLVHMFYFSPVVIFFFCFKLLINFRIYAMIG